MRISFAPKRHKSKGEWMKLQNEEYYNTQSSPYIIKVNNSIKIRQMGHTACIGETRRAQQIMIG
jgi:hypothetical protein